ncbi:hypothetical protein ACE7GA_04895 [Roseomonas sp. CCTCC AB2023176]|uniref:hypothetical protein n=1 Tax=Roseomonas sp. CCTCC AB2023176 TaxID=3342640 RepID=UPI0035D8F1C0
MTIITSRPNDIFPFKVGHPVPASRITVGAKIDLMNTIGPGNLGLGPDPVEVTAVTSTSFTFLTLAGHHRGVGQTIRFDTSSSGGHLRLSQSGTFNSFDPRQYAYNTGAAGAWALQAHNLRVAVGTVGHSSLDTAEKALDAVVRPIFLNVFP